MNNNEQSVSIDHLNTHLPLAYSSTYQHVKKMYFAIKTWEKHKKINIAKGTTDPGVDYFNQ